MHLWYFDQHSVTKLLEQEGYQVYSIRPHFQRLQLGSADCNRLLASAALQIKALRAALTS